ncbi:hypothetical protein [Nocardioides sp. zg-DK7169]|uniref:maltokinase N-terminal cap-like domain-containing protein n=1 Tax=Nocardioides sp. zg-DK7169 TaxID=2736600 RepID=UPI001551FF0D|nr:hypothetical protein [Nocardioides sp. zg-DK7169]
MTPQSRHASTHLDPEVFADYLVKTRWFAGKGRDFTVTGIRRLGDVPGASGEPRVVNHLVELTYADTAGGEPATELYQVPLTLYAEPVQRLDHAFIGWWEEPGHGWVHAYDALHDREAMAAWLRTFVGAVPVEGGVWTDPGSGLTFHRTPGHDLDPDATASLFSGEQSNSTVLFGDHAAMKVFRKVTPGANPDITVHEALTRAGSEHVAALYGWVEWRDPDGPHGPTDPDAPDDLGGPEAPALQLAMLQQFLRAGTDGWDLALTSVRDLFAEADLHAHEVGGDFAGESARLGEALREVHTTLATAFGTSPEGSAADLGEAMTQRLTDALAVVPALEPYAEALRATYARLSALGTIEVQRVHGDLHLGQTVRTSGGWKIVDFEGEPAKPLAQRQLPDSPWRDVAGMLRSFDYAPQVVARSLAEEDPEGVAQRAYRAEEWAERNKQHFLDAYAGGPLSPEQQLLLDAYVADKAVYEAIYETRNRPTWVTIPLTAIARIEAS